jgi:hypothetical protein
VTSTHFIGLDIHKKTISYCVKDVSGREQGHGRSHVNPRTVSWARILGSGTQLLHCGGRYLKFGCNLHRGPIVNR